MEQATLIVDAARRLIAERGGRFTTQELVKEAGVALQTFYRIFSGKDQLLLAVFENLIAESCAEYEAAAADLPDPVSRLRYYVTIPIAGLGNPDSGIGPRFVTAEHWRLHELFPDEMIHATNHFTDLVTRQLELATVLSSVAVALIDAGFASSAQRSFYDYSDEQGSERRAALLTALSTMLARCNWVRLTSSLKLSRSVMSSITRSAARAACASSCRRRTLYE